MLKVIICVNGLKWYYAHMKTYHTKNAQETKDLAQQFSKNVRGGQCICLHGDLGSGKTTFTQGLLKALGAQGPYTSPTFVIMKRYDLPPCTNDDKSLLRIYHIDAYRINASAMVELGWQEMIDDARGVVIVEWPEQITSVLPVHAQTIDLVWVNNDERKITI